MRAILFSILFVTATVGCGDKSKNGDTAGGGQRLAGGAEHQENHPELTPELEAFHEQLKPLWHDDGADREANACAGGGELLNAGAKVQDAGAPEGIHGPDWDASVQSLMLSIVALMDGCDVAGDPGFEDRFTAVHDGLHGLMDLLSTRGGAP